MKEQFRKAIDDNCGELSNYINPLDLLGDGLLSNIDIKGPPNVTITIFSEEDRAFVQARVGTKLQLSCLLSILSKRPDPVFDWFISHLCSEGKHDVARKVWDSSGKEGSMQQFLEGNTCQTVETKTDTSPYQSIVPSPHWQLNHVTNNVDSASVLYFAPNMTAGLFKTDMNESSIEICLLRHFIYHYNIDVVHSTVQLLNSISKLNSRVWFGMTSGQEDDILFDENIKIKFQRHTYSFTCKDHTPDWEGGSPASIKRYLGLVGLAGKTAKQIAWILQQKFNGEWRCRISSSKDNHDISSAGGVVCNIKEGQVVVNIIKTSNSITGINLDAEVVEEPISIITSIIESSDEFEGICYRVKDALEEKYTEYYFVVCTSGNTHVSFGAEGYTMINRYIRNMWFDMYINFMLKSELSYSSLPNTMVKELKRQLNDPVKSGLGMAIKLHDHLDQHYDGPWRVVCGSGPFEHAGYFGDWELLPLEYQYSPQTVDSDPSPDLTHYCHVVRLGG